MTQRRSRLPNVPDMPQDMRAFLDGVDRRQLAQGELDDLDGSATLADVIAKINAMLATQRTR